MTRPPSQIVRQREIQAFLGKHRAVASVAVRQPRLIFAVDATASRQPTWNIARRLQADMFRAVDQPGTLAVQLCYYRGFQEFQATGWLQDTGALAAAMGRVQCEGGHTQIARLLRHVQNEHHKMPLRAMVFIGDALEESPDTLCQLAGECGLLRIPLFLFQEGDDPQVRQTFQSMARLSGGAWAHFDQDSAGHLAQLLGAAARYATGGREALKNQASEGAKLLLQQLQR